MDTISPSSSSSSTHPWKYHVFLSFRGEDTRNNFTDHLYAALDQKGIYTFKDDVKLERGNRISELFRAIEDSLFTIVVLSKNYASSTWCLDELVKIMECEKKMRRIVLPIFYDVEPSVVRKQTGTYLEAFVEHEKRFNKNLKKVDEWRAALTDVTNLSGWSLGDRLEVEFIQEITKVISLKLSSLFPKDINGLVGINSRLDKLMSLLAMGSNEVRIIGIWGMGGIGKTTLARVVYDKVFNEFEGGCFIIDVGGESIKFGLPSLQQKLIREILMDDSVNIRDSIVGVRMIKNRLCHKRVLLVLDNVNQFNQLEKLAGDSKWFGLGSRVIITTRDEHLLTRHKVHGIYEAQELNDYEALRLFSLKAFNKYHPPEDYLDLSTSFVDYAKGLPLAIDVLGSFLYNRSKEEWEDTLDMMKEHPKKEIIKTLEIGFGGLEHTEQEIFLHIACFFNMKEKDYIVEVLDSLRLYPKIGLQVLIERSLLKQSGKVYQMHDLLQQMGQGIVRRDYPQEPGKWSKLWLYKDIHNVLMKNKEMEAIRGLVLELDGLHKLEKAHLNLEALSRMPNLQLLIIRGVHVLHVCKHLSNNLRLLDWRGYPSRSLPLDFELDELGGLNLLDSKIERLWKDTKDLDKLKFIKLNNSLNLIATPDFTGVPNLEKLVFNGCISLHEVHPSLMVLKRLTLLDLENCKSLGSLPNKFEMESLEVLILSGCSKIERIPEFMGNMKRLSKLHLNGTAITELPFSVEYLTNLISLNLRDCKNLVCLPSFICSFKSLKNIDLAGCLKLDSLPEDFGNVESLEVLNEIRRRSTKFNPLNILIPGGEISKWFVHQSAGNIVKAQVTHPNKNVNIQVPSRSSNKWIGIAVCVLCSSPDIFPFSMRRWLECDIVINELRENLPHIGVYPESAEIKSSHLWMSFLPYQWLTVINKALYNQIDENVFIKMEVRFGWMFGLGPVFKKCGFRIVYEQDIEFIRENISAQFNNSTCITPYEGLDVHHDFDQQKGIKMKRSGDEYDGIREMMTQSSNSSCIVPYMRSRSHAIPIPRYYPYDGVDVDAYDCENSMVATESNSNGVEPSGVGSSNDALHPRRIQIHQKRSIKNLWKTLMGKLW
ncbi:hypothetical protein SO802_024708 [Lithocarpus litseifolius]|uniref:ADP-ribosyl cyclase/cyclic ADP-ribose hydrolase n=1 Tax=Lithocarpus litseifolius TaxID=425828 RepID=A0AAW2CDE4_9ROSI